ncbi:MULTISPECIES: DUF7521 family protein [Halomicrobium]|uniref:Uncharacterized protein n=2 Tax=Halomicrobium mukohataei TaxID=57705 RepID=C7NZM5_HALMD|nr:MULTISPECIES: hypothetical protein [Halomicrobium]ACV48793.1 conserved hypothetical protein [Halomicrobium mukohataei DSM 12286]QCD64224.1 hypothetical protein E5139_00735 [Halomicrobium mukohataei]QFR19030.1 hypothetical protein GBQ70_00735 [Halomicrobium sp. ZPS1]
MNTEIPLVVIAFKTGTLALGALITYLAAKAGYRTGASGLLYLAAGFGVVTFGSLLAGIADQLIADPSVALVVESALTFVGFGIIAYSLYVTRSNGTDRG